MLQFKPRIFRQLAAGCTLLLFIISSPVQSVETALASADDVLATKVPFSAEFLQSRTKLQGLLSPAKITPRYLDKLSELYLKNDMKPMWNNADAIAEFKQQLAEVALSGVQPQFAVWATWLNEPGLSDAARDVILSDAMLGYLQFIDELSDNGTVWLYKKAGYNLALPGELLVADWQQAVKSNQLKAYLTALAPQNPQYQKMRAAMNALLADERPWPELKITGTLRSGGKTTSQNIEALTEILARSAVWRGEPDVTSLLVTGTETTVPAVAVTEASGAAATAGTTKTKPKAKPTQAVYSKDLVEQVKRFQAWQGLSDDGSIGAQTRELLKMSPQARAAVMALNIQRLRLLPAKIDTGIMVNIPDYTLRYYIDGKEVLFSRVIVGRTDRKTPLMVNALNNVVVNPPWNVPTKLVREDIVPKLKNDPAYLERLGYTIYSDWGRNAQEVDPSTIDWSTVSPKNVSYRFKQSPGSSNALGRYKFNMPNSEAIYLHDTPNHRLFNKNARAISSGCVRVNKAAELADMLLTATGWDNRKIAMTLKEGKTTHVTLGNQVPVQLYYMTAWVSDDNQLQFRADIYNYDNISTMALKNLPQIKTLLH